MRKQIAPLNFVQPSSGQTSTFFMCVAFCPPYRSRWCPGRPGTTAAGPRGGATACSTAPPACPPPPPPRSSASPASPSPAPPWGCCSSRRSGCLKIGRKDCDCVAAFAALKSWLAASQPFESLFLFGIGGKKGGTKEQL